MNTNDRAELYLEKYMTLKDSSALGDLYVLLSPAVFSFVMSIIHDEEESKDIVQDTFMIVAKKADQYRFGTSVRNWIFEISRNIALARLKKKKEVQTLKSLWHISVPKLPRMECIICFWMKFS